MRRSHLVSAATAFGCAALALMLLSPAAAQPLAAGRCVMPGVAAFPTDSCPWDDPDFSEAMAIVEAARWRCHLFGAWVEDEFGRLARAASLDVPEPERAEVLSWGCQDQRIDDAARMIDRVVGETLLLHLHAGLRAYDAGEHRVLAEGREAWLPVLRRERDAHEDWLLQAIGAERMATLLARADALAADMLDPESPTATASRTAAWSQVIGFTAPLVRGDHDPDYARWNRWGHWRGYSNDPAPDAFPGYGRLEVSSAPLRLSAEGYVPGAAVGWRDDAIHVSVHVRKPYTVWFDPCPECRIERPLRHFVFSELWFDTGFQPVAEATLEPTAVVVHLADVEGVRLDDREWHPVETRTFSPLDHELEGQRYETADVRLDTVWRFVFENELVEAMEAAGDGAALAFLIIYTDEEGNTLTSDDVLRVDSGNCSLRCLPLLPLRGFADTLHWAVGPR